MLHTALLGKVKDSPQLRKWLVIGSRYPKLHIKHFNEALVKFLTFHHSEFYALTHYKPGLTSEVAFIEKKKERILEDRKADGESFLTSDPYSLGLYGHLENTEDLYNMWIVIQLE